MIPAGGGCCTVSQCGRVTIVRKHASVNQFSSSLLEGTPAVQPRRPPGIAKVPCIRGTWPINWAVGGFREKRLRSSTARTGFLQNMFSHVKNTVFVVIQNAQGAAREFG